jgi:S1-C subfamily serine protease
MKLCQTCGQHLAEEIPTCPVCGSKVAEGRSHIDDFRILDVLQEGHASILCKAVRKGWEQPVMIRIFGPQSGVDEKVAQRLQRELAEIRELPRDMFVAHRQVKRSSDGLWYRVSEWVDAENWGDLVASGRLRDYDTAFNLFRRIAEALETLHRGGHFIPHLILDDIMVKEGQKGRLSAKIDYKLSRFIDPKLDRPGPQLKQLLDCHPDIVQQRPLDHRSDIWSLGRIFVQLLSAEFEPCDLFARIEELPLPGGIKTLFKTMLADDPNLRPQTMAEVAAILGRVTPKVISSAQKRYRAGSGITLREVLRFKLGLRLVATAILLLLVIGGITTWYFAFFRRDAQAVLRDHANTYAGSVAFVLVEYELLQGPNTVYRNRTEGTAFLVSDDGYLITNRHVACPWLEDNALQTTILRAGLSNTKLNFKHRMYLWFEGERAFSRLPGFDDNPGVTDVYFLPSAYRSNGTPRVKIAGVARPPVKTRRLLRSPLGDDFAVLKIDQVPQNRVPIPLDLHMEAAKISRLSPVITIGFPLGSRTQTTHINVSVTHGHVRRSFEELLQVDTSIYSGNSGGPIIDTRGKVIGIASAVAVQRAHGMVPVFTALSDIGMVLPITKAAIFLKELRQGQAKWNGILDLGLEDNLNQIQSLAREGRWLEAKQMADAELARNLNPTMVMAAGIMDVCARQYADARHRFNQALSIDNENNLARLMLYILEWQSNPGNAAGYQNGLQLLDWRSEDEFMGYLTAVFEDRVNDATALSAWESPSEKAWLTYAVALKHGQQQEWEAAQKLLQQTVLAAGMDEWPYYLARSELGRIQQKRSQALSDTPDFDRYLAAVSAFESEELETRSQKEDHQKKIKPLLIRLAKKDASITEKQTAIGEILALDPENRKLLVRQAFLSAMQADWESSLDFIDRFLQQPGRESAARLKSGLLEAEVLQLAGKEAPARSRLDAFYNRIRDPWYRTITECLLGKKPLETLKDRAGEHPEYLITGYTAAGLWVEGQGDKETAVEHYKEALGSYIDYWVEFDLALERIRQLRKEAKK